MRALLPLLLLAAACGEDTGMDYGGTMDGGMVDGAVVDGGMPDSGMANGDAGGGCSATLQSYCSSSGGHCRTYDESVVEVMRRASGACYKAEAGQCGALRYTFYSTGFTGFTEWFDADGTLAAARDFADARDYCSHTSYSIVYGPVPDCTLEAKQNFCR